MNVTKDYFCSFGLLELLRNQRNQVVQVVQVARQRSELNAPVPRYELVLMRAMGLPLYRLPGDAPPDTPEAPQAKGNRVGGFSVF